MNASPTSLWPAALLVLAACSRPAPPVEGLRSEAAVAPPAPEEAAPADLVAPVIQGESRTAAVAAPTAEEPVLSICDLSQVASPYPWPDLTPLQLQNLASRLAAPIRLEGFLGTDHQPSREELTEFYMDLPVWDLFRMQADLSRGLAYARNGKLPVYAGGQKVDGTNYVPLNDQLQFLSSAYAYRWNELGSPTSTPLMPTAYLSFYGHMEGTELNYHFWRVDQNCAVERQRTGRVIGMT